MITIVLVEPEIPQNAGNIIRTCAATGSKLIMVKPLGFEVSDKQFRRAGLDYFNMADLTIENSFEDVLAKNPDATFYFASTKSEKTYADVTYSKNTFIVFGKESYGLSETLLKKYYSNCIRVPMISDARSLNLSNTVAIVTYEALRQNNFNNLKTAGELTGRSENE